jgi:hypothetical protein
MRIQSILMAGVRTASLVIIASIASVPAHAGTININLNFSGETETMPPFVIGTTLFLDGSSTGSILTSSPGLNALLDPVSFHDTCQADLTTGILTGVFTMTFFNNDTLSGNIVEDVSAVLPTQSGPFSGTWTFTGGTGEFTGATGSASIAGFIGTPGFSSGSGTVTGPGVVPEPASVALMFEGVLAMAAARRLFRQHR